ncbi:MAG: GFA family protein [Gammaproteobacteria bacterium]|nr:GFA family protein [Gammaproteobacteria bacterium]
MSNNYRIQCDCGAVELEMTGTPRVQAFCHCEDCRALLDVPYHSIVAWDSERVEIASGKAHVVEYKYPTLEMTRVFCRHCGETLYNTNAMGWRLVSQLLIRKCNNGELPGELQSNAHFYYDRRIVDIDDELPKG